MKREAVAAGRFYPGSARELQTVIKKMVDEKAEREDVIGYYAPHAGYIYSGPVAGAVVSRVQLKDTFVIMGPSHTGMGAPFSIMTSGAWKTPLGEVPVDADLAGKILAGSRHLQEDTRAHDQEHAIEVQLPFIQYFKKDFSIVPIMLSEARSETYKEIGHAVAEAVKASGKKVVIVASGDMTHYEPQNVAREKDMKAVESMLKLDAGELLARVRQLNITMCGYAPAAVLIYAARELGASKAELVKYGTSGDTTGDNDAVVGYAGLIFKSTHESPQVALARSTVEMYVSQHRVPELATVPPEMEARAGVFVSIHRGDALRGCIGTISPTQKNIAEEIIHNAISSSTQDPRFEPIEPAELPDLNYSVDVLMPPEPVQSKKELDAKRYGVIVEAGWRRGLLLPDLEGVDSVDHQIEICRAKGGIGPNEPVKLYRFEVKRYK